MKLLLVCLDGVRVDLALPEQVAANPLFSTPDHEAEHRFRADPSGAAPAPDHTLTPAKVSEFGVLAPTLQRLTHAGERSDGCLVPMWMTPPTDSGPGWSSILTGSTHDQCNVWWNEFVGHGLARRPDILSRVFFADPSARTMVAADWEAFASPHGPGPMIHQRVDQQRTGQHQVVEVLLPDLASADSQVASRAAWLLNHEGPDASVVYLQNTDAVAHRHGADSEEYRRALAGVDEHLRHLVKAVAERHEALGEGWLVAVTTDHGHKPEGGHGEDEVEVRRSFLVLHLFGGRLPEHVRQLGSLRSHQVMDLLLDLIGVRQGSWEAGHGVGERQDIPPAGPTRDLDFEW